jgi:hypothetical protein
VAVLDPDNDGISDSTDLDDDNDGILDTVECPLIEVYTWSRTNDSRLVQSLPITITGSTTQTTIVNQQVPGTYEGNWKLIASNVFPDATGKVTVVMRPNSTSNGTIVLADAMRIVRGNTSVIIDNQDATGYTEQGVWYGWGGTGSYKGQDRFAGEVNTAYTATWTFICLSLSDTDNDGILDSRELDSDGDGCPDAIEGGAVFTTANTTATGALSGPVSSAAATLGIPTLAGTGQGVGVSQNAAVNGCLDTDNDAIPDLEDLDDDNDGILDINEQTTCLNNGLVTPLSATASPAYAGNGTSTIDGSAFSGVGLSAVVTAPADVVGTLYFLDGLTSPFVEYTMPANSNVSSVVLWAPDVLNYGVGDGPVKDFTVEVTYGSGQIFTSSMFTKATKGTPTKSCNKSKSFKYFVFTVEVHL